MSLPNTEQLHKDAEGLDLCRPSEAALRIAKAQAEAARAPLAATDAICAGASAMASALRDGHVLWYVAAGSSGLMAAADAMELGGTFGIPARQIRILMAGGLPQSARMPGDTEDATEGLRTDLATLSPKDVVITVSASGSTPYTLAAAEIAKDQGAAVIGIANNDPSPLLALCDHPVFLPTPPEIVSGSTRMGAGTAQKIALNMLSTLMALELGHIHDGMMVNLRADNTKLRARAAGIVQRVTGVTGTDAVSALITANGDVKLAAMLAAGASAPEDAQALLNTTHGHLRQAMERLAQQD